MDITERIQALEQQIELYQDEFEPEEKMDIKQTIQIEIKSIKKDMQSLPADLQKHVMNSLSDFEEILTY